MSLWPRLWLCFLSLVLSLGLGGCSPRGDSQLDEQKNPNYQAGKDKLAALDYKGAIESFERALEDNPRSVMAHFELGVLYDVHENDYAAALYHYNKVLRLRPNGHPAENIKQRIPACKQELVKADSLTVINPTALRDAERLREENHALIKQIEILKAALASRAPAAGASGSGSVPLSASAREMSRTGSSGTVGGGSTTGSTTGTSDAPSERPRAASTGSRSRTYVVRAGDTLAAIARQYQLKAGVIESANPGLDPRRLRVGQTINLPTF